MKKVLIIGRKDPGEKNDVAALADGLNQHGPIQADYAYFEELVLKIQTGKSSVEARVKDNKVLPSDYELIIQIGWSHDKLYSDLAHAVAMVAEAMSVEVWNSELLNARSMTKVSQLVKVASLGIDVPDTIFSLSKEFALEDNFISYPLVAKDPKASRGRRNFLVGSREELEELSKKPFPLIFQQYIENDSSDIRVITAAGKPALAFRRIGQEGSHLNNTSAGARAEIMEDIPANLADKATKIAKRFSRELCGIDFMLDLKKNDYIFLEVNATPQLVSGVFIDRKLAALAKAITTQEEG